MKDLKFNLEDKEVETNFDIVRQAMEAIEARATAIEDWRGWDDLRFPFTGSKIDVSSGRIDYNYFNGAIAFQANARYPNEPVSMNGQLQHSYQEGTSLRPHIHWIQQGSDEPNWLLAYKFMQKGEAVTVETDYSNHTLSIKDSNVFTYTSGALNQITDFPEIPFPQGTISDSIHFVIFRDSSNTSGLFAGADPSAIVELANEFDAHYFKNTLGSRQEFVK